MVGPAFSGFRESSVLQEGPGLAARGIVLTYFGQSEDSGIIRLRSCGA